MQDAYLSTQVVCGQGSRHCGHPEGQKVLAYEYSGVQVQSHGLFYIGVAGVRAERISSCHNFVQQTSTLSSAVASVDTEPNTHHIPAPEQMMRHTFVENNWSHQPQPLVPYSESLVCHEPRRAVASAMACQGAAVQISAAVQATVYREPFEYGRMRKISGQASAAYVSEYTRLCEFERLRNAAAQAAYLAYREKCVYHQGAKHYWRPAVRERKQNAEKETVIGLATKRHKCIKVL